MAPMSLPPGFRFHPTDQELVAYYLDRKISGRTIDLQIIPEVDLYKCEPWDLPEKSFLPSKDLEWYFYSRRDKKYPNGSRTNRATRGGYWKATGKDRAVVQSQKKAAAAVGMKKTLVYYKGRAPHGIRTNWVMHEYRLLHSSSSSSSSSSSPAQHPDSSLKDSYALCRVFKKSIQIPKKKDEKTEEDIEKELGSGDEISERQLQVKDDDDDDDDDDMELQINYMMNEAEFHGVSKSDVTNCSDSDVTQQGGSTPNQTPFHHQTSSSHHLISTTTAPFTSVVDEANSSCTAHHHHTYLQSYFPLSSSSSSIFQDLEMSSYTTSLNYQAPYPPMEFDDFPQINNIFSASSSSETTKPESNDVNTPIDDDFINMYDDHNKCKGGQNVINGALEDIFSLCSSSSHENNNPIISLSMKD